MVKYIDNYGCKAEFSDSASEETINRKLMQFGGIWRKVEKACLKCNAMDGTGLKCPHCRRIC